MPTLPSLSFPSSSGLPPSSGITLVVYAPFGEENPIVRFHGDKDYADVSEHPLADSMKAVAALGINTMALVDRIDGSTWLQELPAFHPEAGRRTRIGALDLRDPQTLTNLIRLAADRHPGTALVLAIEGHGTGFMPVVPPEDLDAPPQPQVHDGVPLLGMGSPLLPDGAPMSTADLDTALAEALSATGQRLAVVHLNNCFNMSFELLHTLSPYAFSAAGYLGYNFFSAGQAYLDVFTQVVAQPGHRATTLQLAQFFAQGNRKWLDKATGQPTAGGAIDLSRMAGIAAAVDRLGAELMKSITMAPTSRTASVAAIQKAIAAAQHYDTDGDMQLAPPDEVTDLRSFAKSFLTFTGKNATAVKAAATALDRLLAGVFVYGVSSEVDNPAVPKGTVWQLNKPDRLAMNIFCPDPMCQGLWDWRSPFYLHPGPKNPSTIPFLREQPNWVAFITEYHRGVGFKEVLKVPTLIFPLSRK